MLSSQEKNEAHSQNLDALIIKTKKPQFSKELEDSDGNFQKQTPKLSPSKTKKLKTPLKSQDSKPFSQQKSFAPFIKKSLYLKADPGFGQGAVSYNEKHNIIIASPDNKTIQFYNATTLLPLEGMKTKKLESNVVKMSFCEETETYLLGCSGGEIYAYIISNNFLQKVSKHPKSYISAIT